MKNFSKPYIYLALIFCFAIFAILVSLFLPSKKPTTEETPVIPIAPSSSSISTGGSFEVNPILTAEVPFNPPSQGGGVNLESSLVQQSQAEVTKILPFLPYETAIQTPAGGTVSILIPGAQFQTTPWVLDVEIFGVAYQVSDDAADYNLQKDLFKQAASSIFDWIETAGGNPEKIIINWGDRAYIRERAEKWLLE